MDPDVPDRYRAYVVRGDGERPYGEIRTLATADLPDDDVTVRVEASSLNYKDALSAAGRPGVTRSYPFTPGIDAAGVVLHSRASRWSAGDAVIVTSYDLGMNTPGGLGEIIRVPADWPVAMPEGWDAAAAMAFGTAGLTAALALERFERWGLAADAGPVAVTGASGGVGTIATALLAAHGYQVVAITGRPTAAARLRALGAAEVWSRDELSRDLERTLLRPDLGGALDTVGGAPLAQLLKRVRPDGAVAAVGNAAGGGLTTTVYPFILRGVGLLGIDSATCPRDRREAAWRRLAGARLEAALASSIHDVVLAEVDDALAALLGPGVDGRVRVLHRR